MTCISVPSLPQLYGIIILKLLPICDPQCQKRTLNSTVQGEGTAILMSYFLSDYCGFASPWLLAIRSDSDTQHKKQVLNILLLSVL